MTIPKAEIFFESSWEVCNKVGGIYTVIISKISQMLKYYKNKSYFLIGPHFPDKIRGEFEELPPPGHLKNIFNILKKEKICCSYGRWLVSGKPYVVLIDYHEYFSNKDDILKRLWEEFGIDSYNSQYEFYEPLVWSHTVGRFLEEYAKFNPEKKVIAQFHEWMAGAALLYLKMCGAKIGTVFTTHATMLGRTLASGGMDIYSMLDKIDPNEESYKAGMHYKQQTEKACAKNAEVFTTVSEITGIEASHFLGRKPDVLLLNGLDIKKFPTLEESSLKHKLYRTKIREFLMSYFFPYYTFNMEESLIFFICGRNEFHVKGVDLLIESLSELNKKLKESKSKKQVITFFFIPGNVRRINPELIENISYFRDIKDTISDNLNEIQINVLRHLVARRQICEENLIPSDVREGINKKVRKLVRPNKLPPLCTHELYNPESDQIMKAFERFGLKNRPEDNVKVIFYPIFLNGADGLLNTDYYETMSGGHLGIFPSYYEPWGYTPLEAAALGVASVTSDLAGFGRYIGKHFQEKTEKGIFVIKRKDISWEKQVKQLKDIMHYYTVLPHSERIVNKINARALADLADWEVLVENYISAHNLAFVRMK